MRRLLVFLILTLVLMIPMDLWSRANLQHKVVFEDRRNHVFQIYEVDENNHVVAQNFEHPVSLTTDEAYYILEQLRYSKSVFFKWRGDYSVFAESELKFLSEYIPKALQNASSDEWVQFATTVQNRDAGDSIPLLTDGYVFKTDGKLHIVLLNLKAENTKDNRPRSGDPRECFSLGFKRLILSKVVSAPRVIPNSQFFDKPHENWAVINMKALSSPKEEAGGTSAESMTHEKKNLIDRMKILKDLYNKDLITEEEYERKKQEILDEL